jgi:urease accessory protein
VTDAATLSAFRLSDSFLPVGSNSISYGLEQFVADDRVTGAADLRELLETYISQQVGPADLVALRAAHTAVSEGGNVDSLKRICRADRKLTAVTLAAEFRESSQRTGDRLLTLQRDLREDDLLERFHERVTAGDTPGNHAVVLGLTTGLADIDERAACLLCIHSFLTGLLGAAQRLLSLGHTDAQRILDDLRPVVSEAVDDSADRTLATMAPFSPLVDVLAAEHERADRRLFVS